MEWSRWNDFFPVMGALVSAVLSFASLGERTKSFRRNAMVSILVVCALSIAFYWSDGLFGDPTAATSAPLSTRLGLWGLKISGAIAVCGLVAEVRGLTNYVRPVFSTLIVFALTSGLLTLVGALQ